MPTPYRHVARLLLVVVPCAAVSPAQADVYRIVGPDGRITYSDRRPTDLRGQATLLGHAPAGAVVQLPPLGGGDAWPAAGVSARPPARAGSAAAAAGVGTDVVAALVDVLAREELVDAFRDTCTRANPMGYGRYDGAARRWRQQNEPGVALAHAVLAARFSPTTQASLQNDARTLVNTALDGVAGAQAAARTTWCDRGGDDLGHGAFDLRPAAVSALSNLSAH